MADSLGEEAYLESVLLFLNKPDSLAASAYPVNWQEPYVQAF